MSRSPRQTAALALACPTCDARPGELCTRTWRGYRTNGGTPMRYAHARRHWALEPGAPLPGAAGGPPVAAGVAQPCPTCFRMPGEPCRPWCRPRGLIFALRANGETYAEIGRLVGLSGQRVKELVFKYEREMARRADRRFPLPDVVVDWKAYRKPERAPAWPPAVELPPLDIQPRERIGEPEGDGDVTVWPRVAPK